jgi:O-antigen/teichoic acid export membrane protein
MSEYLHSSLKSAAKGTAFVFIGMMVSQTLWFVMRILIVRNLSKEEVGIYSLVIAIASIIAILSNVGLNEGSTRFISIFLGQGRQNDADAVQRASLGIGAVISMAACAGIFLLAGVVSEHIFYKPELAAPFMVISFCIPASVMAGVLANVLRGYGMLGPRVYFLEVGQPLLFLVLLCLIFLLNQPLISIFYAYVFSAAAVFILIACYGYLKTGIGPFALRWDGGHAQELLKFSLSVLSIDVMAMIMRWADTLMLGRYGTAGEVGVYSVGISLAVMLTLPLVALDAVYMPVAGELYAKNRMADLARTYQVLTKWVFSVTLPIFFILFFFPEMTITFLFGERFVDACLPLRILSIGYLLTAFMGTNIVLLMVLGLSKSVLKISSVGAFLNVLLNYVCIKHLGLGMDGAALATSISLTAVSFGYSFALYRHCGIHPLASGYLKPAIGSAVIGAAIYAAAKILPLYFWMLPLYFLLYVGGYMVSLILTRSIDSQDAFLFGEVLNRAGVAPKVARQIVGKIYKGDVRKINVG